jgi:hypothetical protein
MGKMKKSIAIISLLVSVSSAWATLIDNFNRDNTLQTANTVNVGNTDWVQDNNGVVGAGADWFITSNKLRGRTRQSNAFLRNTAQQTISGGGTNFTLSVDVSPLNSNVWIGAVFNYTSTNNYYVLRIKGDNKNYQLLGLDGGVQSTLVSGTISSGTFAQDLFYNLNITSDTAGSFNFAITAQGSSTVLNSVTNYTDVINPLQGGNAGMFFSSGFDVHNADYDNFSLNVIPEPATIGMLIFGAAITMLIRRHK